MSAKRKTLFDPNQARGPRPSPAVGSSAPASPALTVSALLGRVKGALAEAFPATVTVAGEISNLSTPASGHLYFSLKDAGASIGAAMWKARAARLKFRPADGMEVVVRGKVDVYDAQGKLQLYVERITPAGAGALDLAFRQLKDKLEKEGLFDQARKSPPSRFPRGIGLVTSATGAAVRDIQRTLRRRWPGAKVFLYPAPVQGQGAAEALAEGVDLLGANAEKFDIDTIIIARGGGSLEDLWAFNEEPLARAIARARRPVISGVGHEVDVTICDLVADVRAATPTAAAELAVQDSEEIRRALNALGERLAWRVREKLDASRAALQAIGRSVVFRDPTSRVRSNVQRLDELEHRLRAGLGGRVAGARARLEPLARRLTAGHPSRLADRARAKLTALADRLRWGLGSRSKLAGDRLADAQARLAQAHPSHRLALARQQLTALARQLEAMSYRSVLARGFSVTRGSDGKIRRSVGQFKPGERIETELADGKIHSNVIDAQAQPQAIPPTASPTKPTRKKPTRAPTPAPAPKKSSTLFDNFSN
ncbi:MAG: exodeoxyribonuclease VII large subunit [Planctomycetota bacterium]|nr:MAG: exodeoxyribonuclease VII large subunit [Planctomycetota bacterium]